MRIQHNIMAMNAYRNYSNNTSALSKNLEKLSSGYKINRAGDDAAGLAISEKMRAQITGLEAAQKNVKDGISLVNTAEGALQEVQDMMNRMVYLAQESANGIFDNPVDRKALQAEVDQLRDEINRIADSANFNGIKLLDGSLATASGGEGNDNMGNVSLVDFKNSAVGGGTFTEGGGTATQAVTELTVAAATVAQGDVVKMTMSLSDGSEYSVEMKVSGTKLLSMDGESTYATLAGSTAITATEYMEAFEKALEKNMEFNNKVTMTTDGTVTAVKEGFGGPTVDSLVITTSNGKDTVNQGATATVTTEGTGSYDTLAVAGMAVFNSTATDPAADHVFTVNGQKFALVESLSKSASAFASDVTLIELGAAAATAGDAAKIAATINQKTGLNIRESATAGTLNLYSKGGSAGGGLTLQIGDSSDSYNQLTVSIKDMHTGAMGISGISIATQAGAQAAVDVIKDAINYVSEVRGNLGAISNRLDHTKNNLGVMRENITDAESSIRDTDVADEMMAYTKNNILVQSAQAMLAQANQVPQGVLQLLQ
jgi:flagellin